MNPKLLDADGLLSGRKVREGETLGKVGNFDKRENGTTYHLHLDMQVPTEQGWVFVNPYMTLIAGYERLIGGRGREISDDAIIAKPAIDSPSEPVVNSAPVETTHSVDTAAARAVPPPHVIVAPVER